MSSYEYHFKQWLEQNHLVESYTEQESFLLSSGLVIDNQVMYESVVYTTDFTITWKKEAEGILYKEITSNKTALFLAQNRVSRVEIKPDFDRKNSSKMSMMRMKWLWDTQSIYTNLIIPISDSKRKCLFANTFTPNSFAYTEKTGKLRTKVKRYGYISYEEWKNTLESVSAERKSDTNQKQVGTEPSKEIGAVEAVPTRKAIGRK